MTMGSHMKKMVWILALMLMSGVVRGADEAIMLALEETTTLHVGETAVLDLPADGSRFPPEITAEETLVQIRRSARSVWYRAVHPGRDVIIIAPDVPEGHCVSCVTHHYFINVVSDK